MPEKHNCEAECKEEERDATENVKELDVREGGGWASEEGLMVNSNEDDYDDMSCLRCRFL